MKLLRSNMKQLDPSTNKLLTSGVYLALATDTMLETIKQNRILFKDCPQIIATVCELEKELSNFSNAGTEVLRKFHKTETI
jgi:hypothetical protein